VAGKATLAGSLPETYGAFPRDFMLRSIALGLPTTNLAAIEWSEGEVSVSVVTETDADGAPLKTRLVRGTFARNDRGLPARLMVGAVPGFRGSTVDYEYAGPQAKLPLVVTQRMGDAEPTHYRYEFVQLELGKADLEETDGYVPAAFATAGLARGATLWTNHLPYTVLPGGAIIPAFGVTNAKSTGSLVLGVTVVAVAAFLALIHRRWRNRRKE
jgi:hypothetical protein